MKTYRKNGTDKLENVKYKQNENKTSNMPKISWTVK